MMIRLLSSIYVQTEYNMTMFMSDVVSVKRNSKALSVHAFPYIIFQ